MREEELKLQFINSTDLLIKRSFDIFLLLIFLPLTVFLIILISIMIKVSSKGSIIFTQYRVGKDGKLFKIYKFRTMDIDAEEKFEEILKNNSELYEEWDKKRKLKNDPRVTKIGRFLRKTSFDELLQIINVLKGEMSLVGPRPYLPSEIDDIKECADIILSTLPGITGLWQVSGRNNLTFEERVKLDCFYVKRWSIWMDLKILFKTIKVILKAEGAY